MDTLDSLVGRLLIAMPSLGDPNFQRSVVLLAAHSLDGGAFGLVVNRPLDVELSEVLAELGLDVPDADLPRVLAGGPVEPSHGFILSELGDFPAEEDDLVLPDGLAVSGSTATLAAFASGERSGRYSLMLGYSGWHPGQLETEIEENSWLVAPSSQLLSLTLPTRRDGWLRFIPSVLIPGPWSTQDPPLLPDPVEAEPKRSRLHREMLALSTASCKIKNRPAKCRAVSWRREGRFSSAGRTKTKGN